MLLQLVDKITYNYLVSDMLNSTERITYRMKLVFFLAYVPYVKLSVKLLMMNLPKTRNYQHVFF